MIVHTPMSVQQRGNSCGICQNKGCVISYFIEPCQCRGPLGTVHEECLKQAINAKYFDHSSLASNSEGFLTYTCPECQGPIYFKQGFEREFIKCGEYGGCEKLMIGIFIFSLLIILFGFTVPLITVVAGIETEAALYVILTIMLIVVLYNMYKRMTTQFWKATPN